MKLTQVERWILVNQHLILERLYPDQAEDYARTREALEHGYELEYGWQTSHILSDGLSEAECREVVDILEMFRMLGLFHEQHGRPEIDEWKISFAGFDGNNETLQMLYTQYLVKGGKFSEVRHLGEFNSHSPSLARYRRQLAAWKESSNTHNLTIADLQRIAESAVHPSSRSE